MIDKEQVVEKNCILDMIDKEQVVEKNCNLDMIDKEQVVEKELYPRHDRQRTNGAKRTVS